MLVLQCSHCPKAFISHTFLDAHVAKRHSDANVQPVSTPCMLGSPMATPATVPTLELQAIKQQLQQSELQLRQEVEARIRAETQVNVPVSEVVAS